MRALIVVMACLALVAVGCEKQTGSVGVDDYKAKRAALAKNKRGGMRVKRSQPAEDVEEVAGGFGGHEKSYSYEPTGKRDPFRSFILERLSELGKETKGPLEQFELNQLAVVGIVWDAKRKRALVEDPSGRGYVVQQGTAIGKNDGRVINIDDNLVLVRETYEDYVGERTTKEIPMRVRQGQGG